MIGSTVADHLCRHIDMLSESGFPPRSRPQIIQQTPVAHELRHNVNGLARHLKKY